MTELFQMARDSTYSTHDHGTGLERPGVQVGSKRQLYSPNLTCFSAAALLLTAAPVLSLQEQLKKLHNLGHQFYAINGMVHYDLESDPHVDNLNATLTEFNISMNSASEEVRNSIASGQMFYVHRDEFTSFNVSPEVAAERATKILSPKFQAKILKRACEATTSAANAAKITQGRPITLMPLIEQDLEDYVSDYLSRVDFKKAREKKWIPSTIQDILGGSIAPTPVNPEEVKQLREQFAEASGLLRWLPAFLDNLELHFQRLCDLNVEEVVKQGYTTFDDLIRLYYDGLNCSHILHSMDVEWFLAVSAFRLRSEKVRRYGVHRMSS